MRSQRMSLIYILYGDFMDIKDEISKRRKEKWFDVWFSIEAVGVTEDVVKTSLEKHVQKMSSLNSIFVYEKNFLEIKKLDKPFRGVENAYSYVVDVKFFAKNLTTLMGIVMTYGPSAIEILGPDRYDISVSEAQDICNMLAGIVHQFAAAGIGGIVITPEGKK